MKTLSFTCLVFCLLTGSSVNAQAVPNDKDVYNLLMPEFADGPEPFWKIGAISRNEIDKPSGSDADVISHPDSIISIISETYIPDSLILNPSSKMKEFHFLEGIYIDYEMVSEKISGVFRIKKGTLEYEIPGNYSSMKIIDVNSESFTLQKEVLVYQSDGEKNYLYNVRYDIAKK